MYSDETRKIKYNGISVLVHSFQNRDECRNLWVPNEFFKWQVMKHFLLQGGIVTHVSSNKCDKSPASTGCWNIFFLVKMQQVQGLMSSEADEYWGMAVDNV